MATKLAADRSAGWADGSGSVWGGGSGRGTGTGSRLGSREINRQRQRCAACYAVGFSQCASTLVQVLHRRACAAPNSSKIQQTFCQLLLAPHQVVLLAANRACRHYQSTPMAQTFAVIGAGLAGLQVAAQLKQAGAWAQFIRLARSEVHLECVQAVLSCAWRSPLARGAAACALHLAPTNSVLNAVQLHRRCLRRLQPHPV